MSGQIARGVALDDGAALDSISPNTLSVTLRKRISAKGYAHVRGAFYADDNSPGPTERPIGGYTPLDAGAEWRLHPSLELRGLVRNILDSEYLVSADVRAVRAPGVSGSLTAIVQF